MSVPGLVIASVMFLMGIIGTFLPVLPGAAMVFAGTIVYGFMVGFQGGLDFTFYLGQGIAVLIVFLIDYFAGMWGARKFGGSGVAVLGSLMGLLVGILVFGPFGIIIGPFAGAFASEYFKQKDPEAALKVGLGTFVGFLGGTAVKLIIEFAMIIWFFIVAL